MKKIYEYDFAEVEKQFINFINLLPDNRRAKYFSMGNTCLDFIKDKNLIKEYQDDLKLLEEFKGKLL